MGLFYSGRGMPQNIGPYVDATTIEGARAIAARPIASQEAIKILGTNGGGFSTQFGHHLREPTRSPNRSSDHVFAIGAALNNVLGRMVRRAPGLGDLCGFGNTFLAGVNTAPTASESHGNPAWPLQCR